MRGRLQSGQDLVLRGAEGVDEDVSVRRVVGLVEDGGRGKAGGGEEGEVGGRGAGVGYRGGFGLEVEAEEAVFETPGWDVREGDGGVRRGVRTNLRTPQRPAPSTSTLAPLYSPCTS